MYRPGTRSEKSQYLNKTNKNQQSFVIKLKKINKKKNEKATSKRADTVQTCYDSCQYQAEFCAEQVWLWLLRPEKPCLQQPFVDVCAPPQLPSPCALRNGKQTKRLSFPTLNKLVRFCIVAPLPLFCLSISSFSFLACMDISRRLFTVLIMSSGSSSILSSFLIFSFAVPSFFFSP